MEVFREVNERAAESSRASSKVSCRQGYQGLAAKSNGSVGVRVPPLLAKHGIA